MDYIVARALDSWTRPTARKALLILSLVINLGLLCYFKYANFFLDSLGDALRAAGFASSMPVLSVILPVGISFYTFEAINYTVDVYRRKIRPSATSATSCSSSCSSRTSWPGRSSAPRTSCRRFAAASTGTGPASTSACSSS